MSERDAVTGAFGFTGRAIARLLQARGREVVALTNRAPAAPESSMTVHPLDFGRPDRLRDALSGVETLYATYWVRFDRGNVSFERAVVENATLFAAAREAGVQRIVHVSITGADPASTLPYFRGKGRVEAALAGSGVPHAIVRPTLVFGRGDILVGNIAWLLRHLPAFGVPGDGQYPVQPVHVDDLAALCVRMGQAAEGSVVDAAGPETMAFEDLVRTIRRIVGSRAPIVHVPPSGAALAARALGPVVHDVVLTRDEIAGLMAGLLVSTAPPTCSTRFAEWAATEGSTLGRAYHSELARHYARAGG